MRRGALSLCVWLGLAAGARAGAVFISGDDADEGGTHCQGTRCGGLYPRVLTLLWAECLPVPPQKGILAIGVNPDSCGRLGCTQSQARTALLGWNDPANGGPGAPLTILTDPTDILNVRFEDYTIIYVPSVSSDISQGGTAGGISQTQLNALNQRAADIATFINSSNGRLLALSESMAMGAYGWLPSPLLIKEVNDADVDVAPDVATQFPGSGADATNMDHGFYHVAFTGPPGWSGLYVLAVSKETQVPDPANPSVLIDAPVILGGCNLNVTREICGNGTDDDGDGKSDEEDPDCWVCGNNRPDPGEECDDGNVVSGDGCDATCKVEAGAPCPTTPGPIYPLKGVKFLPSSATWSWPQESNSGKGYRVYGVSAKADLDASQPGLGANGSNPNAFKWCETTLAGDLTCDSPNILILLPLTNYLQVVGVCSTGSEGAN